MSDQKNTPSEPGQKPESSRPPKRLFTLHFRTGPTIDFSAVSIDAAEAQGKRLSGEFAFATLKARRAPDL